MVSCGGYRNLSRWEGCSDGRVLVVRGWTEDLTYATLVVRTQGGLGEGDVLRLDGTPGVATEYVEMADGAIQYTSRDLAGALRITSDDVRTLTVALKAVARNPEVDTQHVGHRGIAGKFAAGRARACQ